MATYIAIMASILCAAYAFVILTKERRKARKDRRQGSAVGEGGVVRENPAGRRHSDG